MSIRFSRSVTSLLVVVVMALISGRCWAIYYGLGPSNDEWGLKYDVEVSDAGGDKLNVAFILSDEGRLKPFFSIELIAFSKQADNQGRRSYDVKAPFQLKPTVDGRRAGQVQIHKSLAHGAEIRILTHMVDGQRQPSGGSYYDIPLRKYLNRGPATVSPLATPPASNVTR
ncbi:MAG: hypothetical protein IT427_00980 [Pirellulales bacterium]|nr:hypothetical protein [Pirellulales bacterium]